MASPPAFGVEREGRFGGGVGTVFFPAEGGRGDVRLDVEVLRDAGFGAMGGGRFFWLLLLLLLMLLLLLLLLLLFL